ncbi:MAG: hypothetical protein JWO66_2941 [Candidatus Eremiobacteraeota bacterium]|nr:hypothetical protein [Candidatus Eremiobacteraeota bacterium]
MTSRGTAVVRATKRVHLFMKTRTTRPSRYAYRIATAVLLAVLLPSGHLWAKSAVRTPSPPAAPAVFTLNVVSAQRAAEIVRKLYPSAHVSVDRGTNSIIVVGEPNVVSDVRGIMAAIDVKNPLGRTTQAVSLHAVDPAAVAGRLRGLFPNVRFDAASKKTLIVSATASDLAQITAIIATLDAPATPPPGAPETPASAEAVRITQARPRDVARAIMGSVRGVRALISGSNVLLVGAPDSIARAKTLVAVLDAPPADVRYTQIYRLRFLDAASVGSLIGRSFSEVTVTVDKELNAITVQATAAQQRRIADSIAQLDGNASSGQAAANGLPLSEPGSTSQLAGGSGTNVEIYTLKAALPALSGGNSTTASDIAQNVTQALQSVVPDLRVTVTATGSQLILTGTPYGIKLGRDLIERLDVAQKLVVLDTEILEVDENSAKNIGLTFSNPLLSTMFSEVSPLPDFNGNPQRLAGFQAIQRTPFSLGATLNALVQNGKARVLADPRITTISGRTATIRAGDTISILTTTGGQVGTVATTQVQSFQTGVTLDITPIVNAGNFITVMLHPTVNNNTGFLNGVPQISTRDTQTTVALQEDQTLIIGGLIQESSTRNESKLPLLGDLPLVGKAFRNTSTTGTRNELVITVTPHIVVPGEPAPFSHVPLPAIPTPRPLPTLPPGTSLPPPRAAAAAAPQAVSNPIAAPAGAPSIAPLPPLASVAPKPLATPAAFASANVFTYGAPPRNNFAKPTDPVQIYYATLSPTVLRSNAPVNVAAITSTNVVKVTVAGDGFRAPLAQSSPGQWVASFPLRAATQSAANTTLTLTAMRDDGSSAALPIPVSIIR